MDDLGLGIVSGRLPEGSLLPGDTELLARYDVSRTVLREALKTLSAKGLVQARARVGTRVRPRGDWNLFDSDVLLWHAEAGLTPGFLRHLAEIRMALEPEAAAFAALRRNPADVTALGEWLSRMSEPGVSYEDFARADLGFHLVVARAAANPFFQSVSTLIEVVLEAMLTASTPTDDDERLRAVIEQHERIARAIADQDADEARRAMRTVIHNGLESVNRANAAG